MLRPGLRSAVIAVTAATVLTACGTSSDRPSATSSSHSPAGGLQIMPVTATPASQVSFSFVAPDTAGVHGHTEHSFVVMVSGPRRAGCVGAHSADAPVARKGQTTRVTLGPAQLGGNWCIGDYIARVEEFERAHCSAGQMCPQYIRIVGIVGRAKFRVAAG